MLILSRSAQGIGGAIVFATSLALLGQSFRGKERGIAFGLGGAVTASPSPSVRCWAAHHRGSSWRGIFLVNLPIGVPAWYVTLWKVRVPLHPSPAPRLGGFHAAHHRHRRLVYGLVGTAKAAWSNNSVISSLGSASSCLVSFVVVEFRIDHPMFDMSLFAPRPSFRCYRRLHDEPFRCSPCSSTWSSSSRTSCGFSTFSTGLRLPSSLQEDTYVAAAVVVA